MSRPQVGQACTYRHRPAEVRAMYPGKTGVHVVGRYVIEERNGREDEGFFIAPWAECKSQGASA